MWCTWVHDMQHSLCTGRSTDLLHQLLEHDMPGAMGNDATYAERIAAERVAWDAPPKGRDPFALPLAALVGGGERVPTAPTGGGGGGSSSNGGGGGGRGAPSVVSKAPSRASSSSSKPSQPAPAGSLLSAKSGGRGGSRLAAGKGAADNRSALSAAQSSISWRTPSSIRSSEPSAIARNKIAELQLRVELERVLRLQTEAELAAAKMEAMSAKASSLAGDR